MDRYAWSAKYAQISGFLLLDAVGRIRQIGLNQQAPFASVLLNPLRALLAPTPVAISLVRMEIRRTDWLDDDCLQ